MSKEAFNGAKLTPHEVIQGYPPPDILDLYAYYCNWRTQDIARSRPWQVVWSVGLEFMQTGRYGECFPGLEISNLYQINADVPELLRLMTEWRRQVNEIYVVVGLVDNHVSDILTASGPILRPGGCVTMFDVHNDDLFPAQVPHELFDCQKVPLEERDFLSDWVSKHADIPWLKKFHLRRRS